MKLMLVDDHAIVRMGFVMLLSSCVDMQVVAEAASGEEACSLYAKVAPDIVVMDISMAGIGGIEATRRLCARDPRARVLALSAHEDNCHPRRALQAGARGYLSKRSAPEALVEALRTIATGGRYLDMQIAQRLALDGAVNNLEQLSAREFEVFLKLARGLRVAEIAEVLKLSASTVGSHLYSIKQKLGLSNQAEMTLLAVRNGLIEVGA